MAKVKTIRLNKTIRQEMSDSVLVAIKIAEQCTDSRLKKAIVRQASGL